MLGQLSNAIDTALGPVIPVDNLGFAETVSKGSAQAAGLATLSDNEFGVGPTMSMLPKTWDPETPEGEGQRG